MNKNLVIIFFLLFSFNVFAGSSPVKEIKLPSGLTVIYFESHKVPLVTIVLSAKAGAMTETPDINGLTHLWEHMFFKGNARLPNQEAFKKRVRQLGITYNGDTAAEKVRYFFTLPSVFLKDGLQFMADAISTPLLEKSELQRERLVVLNEYDRNASQPGFKLFKLASRVIYGDLAYKRDALGNRSVVTNATRDQLLKIKSKVFVPSNCALLISGDFDPKTVVALVKKYFSSWKNPKGWKPPTNVVFQPFPKTRTLIGTHKEARNSLIEISYNGPRARISPKDTYSADILISLLNLLTGKFYKTFIDSGLTQGAGLSYHTQSQAGKLSLYASLTNPKNIPVIKTMLIKSPQNWLKKNYFSLKQLKDVRRSLIISHKKALNLPSSFIKNLAFWWAITGMKYYNSYLDNLNKVTLKDVRSFIKKYFIDKPYVAVVLTSPKGAKEAGLKENTSLLYKKYNIH